MTADPLAPAALARLVDHTLLRPSATAQEIVACCEEADRLGVYAVCVSPTRVALAVDTLAGLGSALPVAAVAGFPSGAHLPAAKAFEAALAVGAGAAEIDVVIDLGSAAEGQWSAVESEIAAVRRVVPGTLKVILESALLDPAALTAACRAAEAAGADLVKTSSGFSPAGGASVEAVRVLRAAVGDRLGIKASGGIRTFQQARALVDAGATRLGLSGTRTVVTSVPA